jgi:hypothetical protein
MDRSFTGRCHPDNLWALQGLASCLSAKLEGGSCCQHNTEIIDELNSIKAKIAEMSSVSDTVINVACMCATVGRK